MNVDDIIPRVSLEHGIRVEIFDFVEKKATIETSYLSTNMFVSIPKSSEEMTKRKSKYVNIVSKKN